MAILVVEVTENCNSNCIYCKNASKNKDGISITSEILQILYERIHEYLALHNDEINILWHGGEPLMLGPGFFWEVFKIQKNVCTKTMMDRIHHSIQTNLTLFSEYFVPVFKKLCLTSIGTSFDPIRGLRGIGAVIDSEKYSRKFMHGVEILEKYGFDWGINYVVTKKSLSSAEKIFYFLTNLQPQGIVNFNPVLFSDYDGNDLAITPDEFADFLGDIFRLWWKNRFRYESVQPFCGIVESVIKKNFNPENMKFGVCDLSYFSIEVHPDGNTYQNGTLSYEHSISFGNIDEYPLETILKENKNTIRREKKRQLLVKECIDCALYVYCHGTLDEKEYMEYKSYVRKDEWCRARVGFIENYFKPITGTVTNTND